MVHFADFGCAFSAAPSMFRLSMNVARFLLTGVIILLSTDFFFFFMVTARSGQPQFMCEYNTNTVTTVS